MQVSHWIPRTMSILICVGCLSPVYGAATRKTFDELVAKANSAQRAALWDDAFRLWQEVHAIAPAAVMPSYGLAITATRCGRIDEAFEWLDRAVAGGFDSISLASADDNLAGIRDDPRWPPLVLKMRAQADQSLARVQAQREDPDPSTVHAFKSYKTLAAAFDRASHQLDSDLWRMSRTEQTEARFHVNDQRIAAVHRYLREHPGAKDSGDAAWDAVSHRITILAPFYLAPRWGAAGVQVIQDLDLFVSNYPTSSHRGEALMDRAFAVFHVRDEGGSADRPWTDDDLHKLGESLGEVAETFVGTTPGGLALAWRLVIANIAAIEATTPEMGRIRAELVQYATDHTVQEILATEGRAAIVRMDGIEDFEATDLAGTKWSRASFAGKITLIDFWATWCVPCILELPTLRQAWAEFHERGFQIVGVSLDSDRRQIFESWVKANGVVWPQVWDGKGWDTALVRRFQIRAVPFGVLIDRDGHVLNVDVRGDALLGRIKEIIFASRGEHAPPQSSAP